LGLNPIAPAVETALEAAIATAREQVRAFAPELVVLIAPDHYNGFFNELMPPFCIGTEANSVGDYSTPSGSMNVDASAAIGLAKKLMDEDFDIAISRRMSVDHGFAQALQLLWGSLDTPPVLPIFMNAVAQPGIPRMPPLQGSGRVIGRFLDTDPRRTLLIGSGAFRMSLPCLRCLTRTLLCVSASPASGSRPNKSAMPRRSASWRLGWPWHQGQAP